MPLSSSTVNLVDIRRGAGTTFIAREHESLLGFTTLSALEPEDAPARSRLSVGDVAELVVDAECRDPPVGRDGHAIVRRETYVGHDVRLVENDLLPIVGLR